VSFGWNTIAGVVRLLKSLRVAFVPRVRSAAGWTCIPIFEPRVKDSRRDKNFRKYLFCRLRVGFDSNSI